jgi:hypothetical protein
MQHIRPTRVRRYRFALAVALIVSWTVWMPGAWAQAILAPGDVRLRSDLELLADSGVIELPLTTWPIPLDMLTAALDGVPEPSGESAAALAAFYRVQKIVDTHKVERSLIADASVSDNPTRLRTFEDTPRTASGAGIAAARVTDDWDGTLAVGVAGAPQDGQVLRFDGSYIQGVLGNWLVGAYAVDRWWGPGWDGSLILSNAARPIPALALSRRTAEKPGWRWLRPLGNWDATFLVGKLGDRTDIASPEFAGMRLTIKPASWFELGISRTVILCGAGVHCTFSEWINKLDEQHNRTSSTAYPSKQLAGWDLRSASPWRAVPVAIYGQLIGADAVGGFPDDYFALFGAEAWHSVGDGAVLRAHLEWANTACRFYNTDPHWYCAYADNQYFQGDRYRGFPIGDSLDQDAEALSARAEVTLLDGQSWSLMAREGVLDRTPGGDPENSLTPVSEQFKEIVAGWHRSFDGHDVSVGLGTRRSSWPTLGQSKDTLEAYIGWSHGL